ncbi:MAG: hypothetical protein GX303_04825 [Clostridiales bacterium]|nr:hypothetical protein [Clostridiales bacterium]
MKNSTLPKAAAIGLVVAVIHFILFFIGVRFVLQNDIDWKHILSNAVLSLIIGAISFALYLPRIKFGFYIFIAGIAVSFAFMFSIFSERADGWADLAGLMTYFLIDLIALICAVATLIIVFIVKKLRMKNDFPTDESATKQ